jgi:uncharacterized protein
MTPQEEQMLQDLTERINGTELQEKDPDAEQFLQQTLGRNPDALYILAQTVLVQQYALEQAKKQLADARGQLDALRQQPKHATSFLGNLLGRNEDEPSRQAPPPPPPLTQPQYTPVVYSGQPAVPSYGVPQSSGFLRSALQTATGVAAGALAFEGIESLMHGFGHSAGYGSGFGGFGESNRPEEIVNNYYGDSAPNERSEHLSPDIEDRRGESRFSEAVDSNDHGESLMDNDDSTDVSNDYGDDSASFDDGSDTFDSGNDDSSF